MKEYTKFLKWLKDKSIHEIIDLLVQNSKHLIKKFGDGTDLRNKGQIGSIDDFRNLLEYYFKDKFSQMARSNISKSEKEKLLTVEEVAKEPGITKVTVYSYIRNKTLIPVILGPKGKRNIYRFERSDIEG